MSFFQYFPDFPEEDIPQRIRDAVQNGELIRCDAHNNLVPGLALPEAERWADEAELFICETDPAKRHGELRDAGRFIVQSLGLQNEAIYEGCDVEAAIRALKDARVAHKLLIWASEAKSVGRAEAYRYAARALIGANKTGGAR